MSHGFNIDTQDRKGRTALHELNNVEWVEYLLRKNANINAQDYLGNTPLHYAVMNNIPKLVECLLRRSPNVNLKNSNDGHTCLYIAVKKGYKSIVVYLS